MSWIKKVEMQVIAASSHAHQISSESDPIEHMEDYSMRPHRLWLKQIAKLGLLMMVGVSMNVDAGLFGHTMSWKEEVLLHDGSKIIAERHYNLGGYPAIESQERAALD